MNDNKNFEALDRIYDNHEEILEMTDAEVEKILEEEGLEVNVTMAASWQKAREAAFRAQISKNKKKTKFNLDKAREILLSRIKAGEQMAIDAVRKLLEKKQVAVQFRNLEEWNEQTMREVLDDFQIVELLDVITEDE